MESDLEDKFLRIREENLMLKKQTNEANNSIKLLTTKLNRLLEMRKRAMENDKSKKQVSLEEMIFDLQLKLGQLESENKKLRQRSLVLQTKLDVNRRRQYRSMYSSVPSRTDSGLGHGDVSSLHHHDYYSKPSSARMTVHHRSSSTISLNRVTFNSPLPTPVNFRTHSGRSVNGRPGASYNVSNVDGGVTNNINNKFVNDESSQQPYTVKKTSSSHSPYYSSSGGGGGGGGGGSHHGLGKSDFALQLLKESQEEIIRLHDIIILQQSYIENLNEGKGKQKGSTNDEDKDTSFKTIMQSLSITDDKIKSTKANQQDQDSNENEQQLSSLTADASEIQSEQKISCQSDEIKTCIEKTLQVFKSSTDDNDDYTPGKILASTNRVSSEIAVYIEKLTSDLIDSHNMINRLRAQLIKDNLATVKINELSQKVEHLTQENEILQKSLQNCIGTCISGLRKDDEYGVSSDNGGVSESASSQGLVDEKIKSLHEKVKQLRADNLKASQCLEEKVRQYNLLQAKYNQLKDAYDLMIQSSRSLKKVSSARSAGSTADMTTVAETNSSSNNNKRKIYHNNDSIGDDGWHDDDENCQQVDDKSANITTNDEFKTRSNQRNAILDSLGQVREMVNCVQNHLENGLKSGEQDIV